jgi:hypothetical protein
LIALYSLALLVSTALLFLLCDRHNLRGVTAILKPFLERGGWRGRRRQGTESASTRRLRGR